MSFLDTLRKAVGGALNLNALPEVPEGAPRSVRSYGNLVVEKATSGAIVTDQTALKSSAVLSCVRILAETIGQIPLVLYERTPDGHGKPAVDHPVYQLLNDSPNFFQTPIEFKSQIEAHVALRGNGFAYVTRDQDGIPRQLIPIMPSKTQVLLDETGMPWYQFLFETQGVTHRVAQADVLHIRWLSYDNYLGMSPIMLAAEKVGYALTSQEYANRLFSNSVQPGLILTHPGTLGDDGRKFLRESLEQTYRGSQNAFKAMILEEGMSASKVSMTAQEAQYLQSREFNDTAIAAMYGIPPHMINLTAKSTSWGSGLEQMTLGFLKYAMGPRFKHWIERIAKTLLTAEERQQYYFAFDTNQFLRGDSAARFAKYSAARTAGILTINECRNEENLPALPGGDNPYAPLNSTASGPPLGPDGMPLPPMEAAMPDRGDLTEAEIDR